MGKRCEFAKIFICEMGCGLRKHWKEITQQTCYTPDTIKNSII